MAKFPSRTAAPQRIWLLWGIILFQLFLSGCEPVRKKFIRKKRTATEDTTVQPVFEPEEYLSAELTPAEQYQGHYERALIWNKEVIANMEEKEGDKRILFSLKKCLKEIGDMAGFLTGEPQAEVRQIEGVLEKMADDFSSPAAHRSYRSYVRELWDIDRRIRRTLKIAFVQEDFQP